MDFLNKSSRNKSVNQKPLKMIFQKSNLLKINA